MSRTILLFMLVSTFCFAADKNSTEAPIVSGVFQGDACSMDVNQLTKQVNEYLFEKQNFDAAADLLEANKKCGKDKYDTARITDLGGELLRYSYRVTKDDGLAVKASDLYNRALELKTEHDEVIYLHLSILMRDKGDLDKAIGYIGKAINKGGKESKHMTSYLSFALMLAVDEKNWEKAKEITNLLINRDRSYYSNLPTLLATVKTLCHYNKWKIAQQFVNDIENARPDLDGEEKAMFEYTKQILQSCSPPQV